MPSIVRKRVSVVKKNDQIQMGDIWYEVYHQPEPRRPGGTTTLYIRTSEGESYGVTLPDIMTVPVKEALPEWVPVLRYPQNTYETGPNDVIGKAKYNKENNQITMDFREESDFVKFIKQGRLRALYLSAQIDQVET